jgi:DNA-binding transcriptional LysR family regulator
MDLRQTRTFVAVAELGTVSKAALQLHIGQPALSRQISDLEQELGLNLFDRVGRRLLLTSDGEQLLSDCRVLLNYATAVRERAQLLQHGDAGVLKVAASAPVIESVIAGFLSQFAKRYPKVQVNLQEAVGPKMLGMVERGEIHLGQTLTAMVHPDDRRFATHPLHSVDMLAACHPRLILSKGSTIEINRLATYPLLLLDSDWAFRRTFDAACRLAGLKPNILLESRTPHTLTAMAEAGHGVAVIPSSIRSALRIAAVTYRGKRLRVPLTILWDKRRPQTRYATAFCEMLAEYMREIFPITRPSVPTKRGKRKRTAERKLHK